MGADYTDLLFRVHCLTRLFSQKRTNRQYFHHPAVAKGYGTHSRAHRGGTRPPGAFSQWVERRGDTASIFPTWRLCAFVRNSLLGTERGLIDPALLPPTIRSTFCGVKTPLPETGGGQPRRTPATQPDKWDHPSTPLRTNGSLSFMENRTKEPFRSSADPSNRAHRPLNPSKKWLRGTGRIFIFRGSFLKTV